jgi:hypothetical protein
MTIIRAAFEWAEAIYLALFKPRKPFSERDIR